MNTNMQNETSVKGAEKTFYLYDYSNKLVSRAKKIYSPYNVKSQGRTPAEDWFENPDSVEFQNGQYTAREEELGELRYKQQIEWLAFYNVKGGQLRKGGEGQKHKNGLYFKCDGIHIVKAEKIKTEKTETKTVVEKEYLQQIPKIVTETMNVKQLEELANTWGIDLATDLHEIGDVDKIKESIIETLTQAGHIS